MDLQKTGWAVAVALPACCGAAASVKAGLNGALLALGPAGLAAGAVAMMGILVTRRVWAREPLQSADAGEA